jgi:4,5-DOPA dioxygenase extradiol
MNLSTLHKITDPLSSTEKMPVLFLGHGSPMNAIEENEFVNGFRDIAKTLPHPKAILCISAHWETRGTYLTAMPEPQTIHDFGGFPEKLFQVQYPAPGSPELAKETQKLIQKTTANLDFQWGLDHGAWSVIKHLYPKANVPVIEMSLDYFQTPLFHYELAKELALLREKGILIVGSGNIVHNLGILAWHKMNDVYGYDWAMEANEKVKSLILEENHETLIKFKSLGKSFEMSVPTPEHYLPLLYALALKSKDDNLKFFNDKIVAGSLSMTSVKIG